MKQIPTRMSIVIIHISRTVNFRIEQSSDSVDSGICAKFRKIPILEVRGARNAHFASHSAWIQSSLLLSHTGC